MKKTKRSALSLSSRLAKRIASGVNPPDQSDRLFREAAAHHGAGRSEQAAACCERVVRVEPDHHQALHLLGLIKHRGGENHEAEALIAKAISVNNREPQYYLSHGVVLSALGRNEEALHAYDAVLELLPDSAAAHSNRSKTLRTLRRHEESLAASDRALKIDPGSALAHNNRGVTLKELGYMEEALAAFDSALRITPNDANLHNNRANVLRSIGRFEEAAQAYAEALRSQPDCADTHSNRLLSLHYWEGGSREALREACEQFSAQFDRRCPALVFRNPRLPQRRLKIGYVSGDLRRHPVGYFMQAVLANHRRSEVEVHCFSTYSISDDLTERFRRQVDGWHSLTGLSDAVAAEYIRNTGIDVLVDLSGHTGQNRLPVFGRRAAPVQVTWLGYSDTTGMRNMDHILADPVVVPEGEEADFSENIWRLPDCYLCYTPPTDVPGLITPYEARSQRVIFGSFNNVTKLSQRTVCLWSRILKEIPHAELLLKDKQFNNSVERDRVLERFVACGVERERVELIGSVPRAEHFACYNRLDVALDPTPYGGTTTTADALWMGVPVITLRGDNWVGRVSASILTTIGLPELVANDEDGYVGLAKDLAAHGEWRRLLRERLRPLMEASPFCDGPRFTREVEAAYRGMWHLWCKNGEYEGVAAKAEADCSTQPLRLCLGGKEPKPGWRIVNIKPGRGIDDIADIRDLSAFSDNVCEQIYASHVLEHVPQKEVLSTLQGFHRLLRADGRLMISVPDLDMLCQHFLDAKFNLQQRIHIMRMIFGGQTDDNDYHYIGLNFEILADLLRRAGFERIERVSGFQLFNDTSDFAPYGEPISLNVIAYPRGK